MPSATWRTQDNQTRTLRYSLHPPAPARSPTRPTSRATLQTTPAPLHPAHPAPHPWEPEAAEHPAPWALLSSTVTAPSLLLNHLPSAVARRFSSLQQMARYGVWAVPAPNTRCRNFDGRSALGTSPAAARAACPSDSPPSIRGSGLQCRTPQRWAKHTQNQPR